MGGQFILIPSNLLHQVTFTLVLKNKSLIYVVPWSEKEVLAFGPKEGVPYVPQDGCSS